QRRRGPTDGQRLRLACKLALPSQGDMRTEPVLVAKSHPTASQTLHEFGLQVQQAGGRLAWTKPQDRMSTKASVLVEDNLFRRPWYIVEHVNQLWQYLGRLVAKKDQGQVKVLNVGQSSTLHRGLRML